MRMFIMAVSRGILKQEPSLIIRIFREPFYQQLRYFGMSHALFYYFFQLFATFFLYLLDFHEKRRYTL